jgi:hypothetical protein
MFLRRFWYILTFKNNCIWLCKHFSSKAKNWHPSKIHMSLLQIWTSITEHFPYENSRAYQPLLVKSNALKFLPKQQINTPYLAFSIIQTCLKFVGPKSGLEHLTLSLPRHQKAIIIKTGHSILHTFDFLKFKTFCIHCLF